MLKRYFQPLKTKTTNDFLVCGLFLPKDIFIISSLAKKIRKFLPHFWRRRIGEYWQNNGRHCKSSNGSFPQQSLFRHRVK